MTATAANAGGIVSKHASSVQLTVDSARTQATRIGSSFSITGSNIDTTNDPLGMDRLGKKAMKTDDQQGYGRDNTSPFALENTKKEFVKHKKILDSLGPKKIIFESERKANGLLDENQIRE